MFENGEKHTIVRYHKCWKRLMFHLKSLKIPVFSVGH